MRQARGDDAKLLDELGDVLFQVLFLALLLEERGAGDLAQVAAGMRRQADRRHPHVFGEEAGAEALAAMRDEPTPRARCSATGIGSSATSGRGAGEPFADVPENLPGLLYARKILRRAEPDAGAAA